MSIDTFQREVSVFGRNMLDKEHLAHPDADIDYGRELSITVVLEPREVGLTLSLRI